MSTSTARTVAAPASKTTDEVRGRHPLRRLLLPAAIAALLTTVYGGYRYYLAHLPYVWSGTVEARTISVGSRVGGRVEEVLVREGDHVRAGQALVTLEPGDLDAERVAAQGQLDQAKAALAKVEDGPLPEEVAEARAQAESAEAAFQEARAGARPQDVAAARARLAAAQATLDQSRLDDNRMHALLARGAISREQSDDADAALRVATAQRDAEQQTLGELEAGVRAEDRLQAAERARQAQASARLVEQGARPEDLASAKAAVESAQGKLDEVRALLDELTIRAPAAALVETLDLRPGDILAPDASAATLLEDGQLYVRIYVPETELGRVRVGQTVALSVDSFPGRMFRGVVRHVNEVGEYSPRNLQTADERADQVFATRVDLVDGAGDLRAGMAAFAEVPR